MARKAKSKAAALAAEAETSDDDCQIMGSKIMLEGGSEGVKYNNGATTGCGKRDGETAFAQTTCRGPWLNSKIACAYCHDEHAIAMDIDYEKRAAWTVNPIIRLPDSYERDDKEDPEAILGAIRKNGVLNKKSSDKGTNLRGGDVIAKKYYSLECGACCTSRGLASPTRTGSPLTLLPGACATRGMPAARSAPLPDARATRGMPAARFAPCLANVPRVACPPHAPPPCLTHVPHVACPPHAPPLAWPTCHAWHARRTRRPPA